MALKKRGGYMDIINLETPSSTEKYFAPKTDDEYPFYITEYGKTFRGTPCYQIRMNSPIGCVQYVISGKGIIICNDKIYMVNAGDTFLLPQGSNQIYYSNPDNQFERIWVNFKGELARNLTNIYKIDDTVVFKNVNTFNILDEFQKQCRKTKDPLEYKNLNACFFLKLVLFLHNNKKEEDNMPVKLNEQMRLYIEHNITKNIKVAEIAKTFSLSVEHTIRIFKKIYKITPHQYILQSKMRIAMVMLKTTKYSIEEIAEKLNFSSAHHFSTQFKKFLGCKPSLYRKNDSG